MEEMHGFYESVKSISYRVELMENQIQSVVHWIQIPGETTTLWSLFFEFFQLEQRHLEGMKKLEKPKSNVI